MRSVKVGQHYWAKLENGVPIVIQIVERDGHGKTGIWFDGDHVGRPLSRWTFLSLIEEPERTLFCGTCLGSGMADPVPERAAKDKPFICPMCNGYGYTNRAT